MPVQLTGTLSCCRLKACGFSASIHTLAHFCFQKSTAFTNSVPSLIVKAVLFWKQVCQCMSQYSESLYCDIQNIWENGSILAKHVTWFNIPIDRRSLSICCKLPQWLSVECWAWKVTLHILEITQIDLLKLTCSGVKSAHTNCLNH